MYPVIAFGYDCFPCHSLFMMTSFKGGTFIKVTSSKKREGDLNEDSGSVQKMQCITCTLL
jgi:hypothetical protein